MRIESAPPSEQLTPYVQYYWTLAVGHDAAPANLSSRVIPTGSSQFLVHWGQPFEVIRAGSNERQNGLHLCGLGLKPAVVEASPTSAMMAAVFHPWAFSALLGDKASILKDRSVSAELVFGRRANLLAEELAELPELALRRQAFERFLLASIDFSRRTTEQLSFVQCCINILTKSHQHGEGWLPARSLCASERTLQRRFRDATGLRPGQYRRLIRLHRALARLASEEPLARIAIDVGYSDQAHMTREFTALAGASPGTLRSSGCVAQWILRRRIDRCGSA